MPPSPWSNARGAKQGSQFVNCEPFLENCKSKLLKKIVEQLFLTVIIIIIIIIFIPNYFTCFAHLLTKRASKSHKLVIWFSIE